MKNLYSFRKDSNHVKFFKWLWKVDPTERYKNMCPYFWSYVGTLCILPLLLLAKLLYFLLPAKKSISKAGDYMADTKVVKYTGKKVTKAFEVVAEQDKLWYYVDKFLKWAWIVMMSFFGLMILGAIGYGFYKHPVEALVWVGGITLGCIVIYFIVVLFTETNFVRSITYPFRLFGDMVVNLYRNACPLITWEE
jgi:hypothetical protein